MNEKNFDYQVNKLGQRISSVNNEIEQLKQATIDNTEARERLRSAIDDFVRTDKAQYWEDKDTYKKFIVKENDSRLVDELNTQGDLYQDFNNGRQAAEGFCLFIQE